MIALRTCEWAMGAAATCALLALPELTLAQDGVSSRGASGLEEVVVSAQRRAESMQRVPIAVTAVTAADLEKSGVSSTIELLSVTPGLVLTRQVRGGVPYLRGVGSQDTTQGNEPAVATYVDGVYIMDVTANIFSFNNIERVEVLKGPQGTLFGRNATGGLIHVITRDPQVTPYVGGSLDYGNFDRSEVSFYGTGGAGDVAADLAVYAVRQDEGFGHNLATGADVNADHDTAFRSKVRWTPTEQDRLTLTVDWNSNKSTQGFTRNALPGTTLVGGVAPVGSPYGTPGLQNPTIPDADNRGISVHFAHDFSWGAFSVLSAYRQNSSTIAYDQDLVATQLADIFLTQDTESFQNEFLLVGSTGKFDWTAGAFVFHATGSFDPLSIRSIAPSNNYDLRSQADLYSYAAFAQTTYSVTDRTGITVGARYTIDDRGIVGTRASSPSGAILATRIDDVSYSKVTWRLALEHEFTDDILGYVSFNRGFKSGLFTVADLAAPPVKPETLDSVEAGIKSEFFARSLRVNVSAFHYSYEGIQLSRLPPAGGPAQLFNAAKGEVNGAEFEIAWFAPVSVGRLQLNASGSVLDTEYKTFPGAPQTVPNPAGGNVASFQDASGNDMIRAPRWTLSTSADYSLPIGAGELAFNLSYYHNAGFFWEADNRLRQEPYDLVNAQASYAFGDDLRYRVRVWGRNLDDEVYYSYVVSSGLGDLGQAAPPRLYGIGFDFSF